MKSTPKIDINKFNDYVGRKLITRVEHPKGSLYIWNYTPVATYSKTWDDVTMQSRGLITNLEGKVVARPFTKFFNLEERNEPLPDEPFVVHEKFDGSLGILYTQPDGTYALATRGSFTSDQAIKGTELLRKYTEMYGTKWIKPGYTYLFEIIYPENRIVVNYGNAERLVLLAVIHTETGEELPLADADFADKANEWHKIKNIKQLRKVARENAEGFVVHFKSGLRVKLKYAEYIRLHRILTGVSNKDVWRYIAVDHVRKMFEDDAKGIGDILQVDRQEIQSIIDNGTTIEAIIEKVPDEFYDWVRETVDAIRAKHDEVIATAAAVYDKVNQLDRKAIAAALKGKDKAVMSIVWALLDGKSTMVEGIAWRYARPDFERPFKKDIDA